MAPRSTPPAQTQATRNLDGKKQHIPDTPVEPAPSNLADLVRVAAQQAGDRPALIAADRTHTWRELDAAIDAGAAAMSTHPTGARVVLGLPTGPDLAATLFAVLRAGLVAVPVDPAHTDLAWVADRVGAILAVADAPVPGTAALLTPTAIAGWWSGTPEPFAPRAGGEDLALLARASREQPPVMLSHRAFLGAAAALRGAPALEVRPTDRVLQILPLFHVVGLVTAFLPAALTGAAVVLPDHAAAADRVGAALDAIRAHRVSILPAEPTLYRQLDREPGFERALATVRLMTSGSSPLDPADFSAIRAATGQAVREGYGISESAAAVTSTLMTGAARPGSVGLPYPGVQIRIAASGEDGFAGGFDDEFGDAVSGGGGFGDKFGDESGAASADRAGRDASGAGAEPGTGGIEASADAGDRRVGGPNGVSDALGGSTEPGADRESPAAGDTVTDAGSAADTAEAAASEAAADAAGTAGTEPRAADTAAPGNAAPGNADSENADSENADSENAVTENDTADVTGDTGGLVISDDDDLPASDAPPPGDVGEIVIRGDTLFSGYWPDGHGGPGPDGWFRTGDLGYLDDAGELHLVDRAAETVVVAGFTVYPREVEDVLVTHRYVADAAVVGVPGRGGPTVVAALVPRPGTRPTQADLDEFLADLLPPFKRPTDYQLVDVLPRTEVGRLNRAAVRQAYAQYRGITLGAPPQLRPTVRDTTETGPERAAGLSSLGSRLPAGDDRTRRSARDTDDDLF